MLLPLNLFIHLPRFELRDLKKFSSSTRDIDFLFIQNDLGQHFMTGERWAKTEDEQRSDQRRTSLPLTALLLT